VVEFQFGATSLLKSTCCKECRSIGASRRVCWWLLTKH